MKTKLLTFVAAAAMIVAGCSGGTGGTGATSPGGGGSPAVSIGVMKVGSVVVNGVNFNASTASIRIDDTSGTPADLKDGMVVKVRGLVNDDRVTGTAQQVEVEKEVRGLVQSTNANGSPASFTVNGQTVFVDDLTFLGGFATVSALVPTTSIVEVSGLRDAAGNIHASRVELLTNSLGDELMGFVSSPITSTAFVLTNGAVNVNVIYSLNAISPPSSSPPASGARVELLGTFNSGSGVFTATQVEMEDIEDVEFQHAPGEDFSIEGIVSGCVANVTPCALFAVKNQQVQTNPNTRFVNGSAADLANGIPVEAEGHQFDPTGTTLIAEKIQFERTQVMLNGIATFSGGPLLPGANAISIQVLGQTVQVTSLTQIIAKDPKTGIVSGTRVEVDGYIDTANHFVAQSIQDNPSGKAVDAVQARVVAVSPSGIITFEIGINADLSGVTTFTGANDVPIANLAAFLQAVTPSSTGGTLVKVRSDGSPFNPATSTIVADEAQIED